MLLEDVKLSDRLLCALTVTVDERDLLQVIIFSIVQSKSMSNEYFQSTLSLVDAWLGSIGDLGETFIPSDSSSIC
jgi:hypothetical protein